VLDVLAVSYRLIGVRAGSKTLCFAGSVSPTHSRASEFGIWIALLIFAYGHGGPNASMLMVLVQLIPCIAVGPFLGALADRRRPSRVLRAGYGLQAVSMGALAIGHRSGCTSVRRVCLGAAHVAQPYGDTSLTGRPPSRDRSNA